MASIDQQDGVSSDEEDDVQVIRIEENKQPTRRHTQTVKKMNDITKIEAIQETLNEEGEDA